MASLTSVFNHALKRAERAATAGYTTKLREHTKAYGWPDHLVSSLSMYHDGENHTITYPKHLEEQILTLEYGTQDVPPSPALRTFMIGGV
jgi:hypothetical protein